MDQFAEATISATPQVSRSAQGRPGEALLGVLRSKAAIPGAFVCASLVFAFWDLLKTLPGLYLDKDGYYSHGFFMPLTAGYVIYRSWPRLKELPVKAAPLALIPLGILLFLLKASDATSMLAFMSVLFVLSGVCGVWFVAGWRWAVAVAAPICYLLLGLPIWSMAINTYTNPLQLMSTKVSYWMLQAIGFRPFQDGTVIHLNHFDLDVGVPCSGLKLIVALSAFTVFFIMVARLRVWANVFLALLVFPMALVFNGLRIAMIGAVGETYGDAAGHQFHDWSGYIMLLVCFATFYKIVRGLGWKD